MATIQKRGNRYTVQIRRTGFPSVNKTFSLRKDAESWARQKELEIERGSLDLPEKPCSSFRYPCLSELIDRYLEACTAAKKGANPERYFLKALQRQEIAQKTIDLVTTRDWSRYRDDRLGVGTSCLASSKAAKPVTAVTIKRQIAVIRHLYRVAVDEWHIPIKDCPLDKLSLNATPVRRQRRLQEGELDLIIEDAKTRKNPLMLPIVLFAIELGMRRSEIVNMTWKHVDLKNRVLTIPETKNGYARKLPITDKALEILEPLDKGTSTVFPVSGNAIRLHWVRVSKKLGLDDLHFHDLRHEAISTFFERGLNTPEVASISGHRDWRMLAVYTNPRPGDILRKLGTQCLTSSKAAKLKGC